MNLNKQTNKNVTKLPENRKECTTNVTCPFVLYWNSVDGNEYIYIHIFDKREEFCEETY